jgi:hypothetical protein
MDAREERLAKNEIVFREINERIEEAAETLDFDDHVFEFICECSNADCNLRLPLTIAQYEEARRDPAQFVVATGHELPEIEQVVLRARDYQVVRKTGAAGEMAEEHDRRT